MCLLEHVLLYCVGFSLDCLCVHHDSRWRHVSFWWDIQRLHFGGISCLRMCFFCFVSVVPSVSSISKFEVLCCLCIGNLGDIP